MDIPAAEASLRQDLLLLMDQKDELEQKIAAQGQILAANNIGMHEPLIDQESYPRTDIDIVAVRHARYSIICLQNDRCEVVAQLEHGLANYFQPGRLNRAPSANNRNPGEQQHQPMDVAGPVIPRQSLTPFVEVESVVPGSAAELAGLEVGDQMLQIGTLSARNFESLNQIQTIMFSSIGRVVRLLVRKRGSGHEVTVNVTPPSLGIKFQLIVPTMNGH